MLDFGQITLALPIIGSWVRYIRTLPSVKCASAYLVRAESDFITNDKLDGADEYWSVDVSIHMYNEGYQDTSIAEAKVEMKKVGWLNWSTNHDNFHATLSGGWYSKGGSNTRMIGRKVPAMEPETSFTANFMGNPSDKMWNAIKENKVNYYLWFRPLRHKPLQVKLNKPND